MAKTRVAIIGCGTIANAAHAPSYQKNPDVEIAYCVDIIPESGYNKKIYDKSQ